jgi:small-conductance mechanosensitive channel
MLKKLSILLLTVIIINFSGCVFVAAGMRESQKAKQDFNIPYTKALEAVKEALLSLSLEFEEAIIKPDIAVVKGKYTSERTMYIEIFRITDNESRIAVRVGTSNAGRQDAQKILEEIEQFTKQN